MRRVDRSRRLYTFVESTEVYHDACIMADLAWEETRDHHVIWDSLLERVLYDSRVLR